MSTLILLIAATVFLAGLIAILHKMQLRKAGELAEQSAPLPPLDESLLAETDSSPIGIIEGRTVNHQAAIPWQDEVKQLRDNGQFQAALSLCRRQYPRMLAFRQTMITLRSSLHEGQQEEQTLKAIYKAAVLAELARHKKQSGEPTADHVVPQVPDDLSDYWPELGYENLPLLTKTDCRRMIAQWGEPATHHHPEQILPTTDTQDIFHG